MVGHGNPVKSNPTDEQAVHKHKARHRTIDYIIESSEFMKENSLKKMSVNDDPNEVSSHFSEKHVVTGYPRHDLLLNVQAETKNSWKNFLDGMSPKSVILYAPTNHPISADSEEPAVDFFPFDDFDRDELYSLLEKNDALLLFRPHPVDVRNMQNYSYGAYQRMQDQLERLCADSKYVRMATQYEVADTTQLLPFVDILITDYSSIYHDFLLLDRPIIFIPDRYELFEKKKGFRYDYFGHLPGPPVETFSDLTDEIEDIFNGKDNYRSDRLHLKEKVHKFSDGCCRGRVVELIKNS